MKHTTSEWRRSSKLGLTALLIGALTLAGCGSNGSSGSSETTESANDTVQSSDTSSSSTGVSGETGQSQQSEQDTGTSQGASSGEQSAAADLGTLKTAGTADYAITELASPLAISKGMFKDKGLTIKAVSTENTAAALASGDVDVAIGSPGRLAGGLVKGLDVVFLGPTSDQFAETWVVSPKLNITSLSGLKGKKLGISHFGSAGDLSAELLAQREGWKKDEYKIVNLGGLDGLIAGLQNGSIDAFAWPPIATYQLQEQGRGKVLIDDFPKLVGELPVDVIAASEDAVKNKPEAVKAFCEVFYSAQQMLKDDPSVGVEPEVTGGGNKKGEALTKALEFGAPFLSTSSDMSDEMLKNIVDAAKLTTDGVDALTVKTLKEHYTPCSSL